MVGGIILGNKMMLQWGAIAFRNAGSTTAITFPANAFYPFTNVWHVSCSDNNAANSYVPRTSFVTNTGFNIEPTYFGGSNNPVVSTYWVAIGSIV